MTWPIKKLEEACEIFSDGDWIETKDQSSSGIRLIQTGNVGEGFFIDKAGKKSRFITDSTFRKLNCTEIFPGDLLISRLPDPVGRSCLVPDLAIRMITAVDCTIIRANKRKALTKFLLYITNNPGYFGQVAKSLSGTTRQRISRSKLGEIKIPLPSLAIQKQIVDRLDKIAEAQKLNDKLIQKTDELFRSLLHKELNPAGKNWQIKKIEDVAATSSGGTPLKERVEFYENGTIPWLRSGEVSRGLIYRSELFITEKGLENSSAKIFPIDTVLVAMYGATAGQIGLLKFEASTNQAICGIFPNDKFISEYLYYFLKTKTDYLIQISTGGAQPNISQAVIRNLKVPLPDLKAQKQIVAKLSAVQDYKNQLLEQKAKLKEFFDSALAKSMNE